MSSYHLGRANLGAPDSALSCGLVRAQLRPTDDPAQDFIDCFCKRYKLIADRDLSRAIQELFPMGARARIQPRRRSDARNPTQEAPRDQNPPLKVPKGKNPAQETSGG